MVISPGKPEGSTGSGSDLKRPRDGAKSLILHRYRYKSNYNIRHTLACVTQFSSLHFCHSIF